MAKSFSRNLNTFTLDATKVIHLDYCICWNAKLAFSFYLKYHDRVLDSHQKKFFTGAIHIFFHLVTRDRNRITKTHNLWQIVY